MSNMIAIPDSPRFELMEKVAVLKMEGLSDIAIAKKLDEKRKTIIEVFEEYKDILVKDSESRDRARDALHVMVEHYDRLINESYRILKDLKKENFSHNISAQMNVTLKNIAEYERNRLDAWQKAGMLDAGQLGDDLARMEEEKEIIVDILRNELCDACRMKIAGKIQRVTNAVEAVVIYEETGDPAGSQAAPRE